MLNVIITIDTEVYPRDPNWRANHLAVDIDRDIQARVGSRSVGVNYQLEVFTRYGLKAVFMVEPLFSAAPEVGLHPLAELVSNIRKVGHEVQLHLHPEWVKHVDLGVPFKGDLISMYSGVEQEVLLRFGSDRLVAAGAQRPIAFRAGDYAANLDTLAALRKVDFRYDSSFNVAYFQRTCGLPWVEDLGSASLISGITEIPIAAFADYPKHLRPAQLCACSLQELIHALNEAETSNWDFFVIVSHSFEMTGRRWHPTKLPVIRESVVRRFEAFCRYLSENLDRFRTVGFEDLAVKPSPSPRVGIQGNMANTFFRYIQQGIDRLVTR